MSASNLSTASPFCWYELMTPSLQPALDFYARVLGLQSRDAGMANFPYALLSAGGTDIAGAMTLPPEAGEKATWLGYIYVGDVDAYSTRVTDAGGAIIRAAEDIPGIGRFAVASDPQGAIFVLFRDAGGTDSAPAVTRAGHVSWRELHSTDGQAAFAFYSEVFGWTKDLAMDLGPMGTYQLFATGGEAAGAMMTGEGEHVPTWLYYFEVDGIDSAHDRVEDCNGQILFGPQQIPDGRWMAHCMDPQGAMFSIIGPRDPEPELE